MRELAHREHAQREALGVFRQDFEHSLKAYKDHLLYERQMSIVTVVGYCKLLFHFYVFLGRDLKEARKDDFRDFIQQLKMNDYKASTVNTYLNITRSYFNFLANSEDTTEYKELAFYINKNFRIKKEVTVIQVPTVDEIEKLRDFFKSNKKSWCKRKHKISYSVFIRDIAIFEVLIATGARSAELRGIRTKDFDLANNTVLIDGKGGHQRFAIFSTFTSESIIEHLTHNKLQENDLVFKMAQGNMLNYIIKRWAIRAGINPHIHAHSLRHYHITAAQRLGININNIADQVGHTCFDTTRRYTHFDLNFRKEQYGNKNL